MEVSASDPSLRLPMYRGVLTSFEGYNMDNVSWNKKIMKKKHLKRNENFQEK